MKQHLGCFFVTLVVMAALTAPAAWAYVSTIVVSPGATELESGQNLLTAMDQATSGEHWLIKIEPGVYELDGASLVLKDLVDVEGSGRGATMIVSSSGSEPVVDCPAQVTSAEVRELTVSSRQGAGTWGTAFRSSGERLVVSSVDLEVDGEPAGAYGFFSTGSEPRLVDVGVRIHSTTSIGQFTGLYFSGEAPVIRDVQVEILTAGTEAWSFGIETYAENLLLDQATISVSGPLFAVGLWVGGNSSVNLTRATFDVSAGYSYGIFHDAAFWSEGGSTDLRQSEIVQTELFSGGAAVATYQDITVEASRLEGSECSIATVSLQPGDDGKVRVGTSRLVNPVCATDVVCVSSYDGDFAPLSETCQ